jgi:putative ABC transport system permease protein
MTPLLTLRIALRALLRNKLRSFLTTLGVVIGVGAVIAMVAIGEGAKARVRDAFASLGSNLLILMPGSTNQGGVRGGGGSQPSLTWEDLYAIQHDLKSSVRWAAPVLRTQLPVVTDENWGTTVSGTTPEYFALRGWKIADGAPFTPVDVEGATNVIVLGETVAKKLFLEGVEPVGKSVRIRSQPYTVIGVLAHLGQSPMGQDYDDACYVPVSTYQEKVAGSLDQFISGIVFIGATSPDNTSRAEQKVGVLLRDRHKLAKGADDDFSVRNLSEMAAAQQQGTDTLTTLLASIAAVSLLVGGIGIMNIMLVSVTERTREIGVRMAVGAKSHHILAQFLVEALSLSLMGGLLGVVLGLYTARKLAEKFGWPVLVRPDIIVIAVAFSAGVGIVFGLYPARKASRLDPIDALRYE